MQDLLYLILKIFWFWWCNADLIRVITINAQVSAMAHELLVLYYSRSCSFYYFNKSSCFSFVKFLWNYASEHDCRLVTWLTQTMGNKDYRKSFPVLCQGISFRPILALVFYHFSWMDVSFHLKGIFPICISLTMQRCYWNTMQI